MRDDKQFFYSKYSKNLSGSFIMRSNNTETNSTQPKKPSKQNKKQVKVTLEKRDAKFISEVAETLGISETEVLRKGLKLMKVYADAQEKDGFKLVLENDDSRQELLVI